MFYKIYPCVTSVLSSLFKRTDITGFLFLKNSFDIRFVTWWHQFNNGSEISLHYTYQKKKNILNKLIMIFVWKKYSIVIGITINWLCNCNEVQTRPELLIYRWPTTRMLVLVFARRIYMHFWSRMHGSYGHWTSRVTNRLRIIS